MGKVYFNQFQAEALIESMVDQQPDEILIAYVKDGELFMSSNMKDQLRVLGMLCKMQEWVASKGALSE